MSQVDVILVDEKDQELGTMEKMEAHRLGVLHRAFSVFIFDNRGRMLLQRRAASKYHGGLLWTNACCSHPYPGESVEIAANRRLREEMGFNAPLEKLFSFTYRAEVENGLIEHEFDHVFGGLYEGPIHPNAHEVADYVYRDMADIEDDMNTRPELYTSWFRIAFPRIMQWWKRQSWLKYAAA